MKKLLCKLFGHHYKLLWITHPENIAYRWKLECQWCKDWMLVPKE